MSGHLSFLPYYLYRLSGKIKIMPVKKLDSVGYLLIICLLLSLLYAGYLSYKSIDWTILDRLEAVPLNLPPPATASAKLSAPNQASVSAQASPSANQE